jgi:hypothetical protein
VALAGSAVLVAVRGWARRGLGVVVLLAGVVIAIDAIGAFGQADRLPREHAGLEQFAVRSGGGWIVLTFFGAVVLQLAGAFTAWRGGDWAGLGSSYDAPGAPPAPPVTDKAVWDALDRGDDPTA